MTQIDLHRGLFFIHFYHFNHDVMLLFAAFYHYLYLSLTVDEYTGLCETELKPAFYM